MYIPYTCILYIGIGANFLATFYWQNWPFLANKIAHSNRKVDKDVRERQEGRTCRQAKEEGGKADSATLAKSNKPELRGKKTHSDSCTEIRLKRWQAQGIRDGTPGLAGVGLIHRYTRTHTLTQIHLYMCESTMSVAYVCHMETAEDFKGCFTS